VAVEDVPDDGDRVAVQAEGDGALDGSPGAALGLADAEEVAAFGEGDLNRPTTMHL
jgi:hypothetical protein